MDGDIRAEIALHSLIWAVMRGQPFQSVKSPAEGSKRETGMD